MAYKLDKLITDFGISYYQCAQDSPKVVFVHGLFGSGRNWGTFLRFVAENLSLTCAALDQRGHGESQHFEKKAAFQILVEDLAQFIRTITSFPVILIGHSLGGKVAMRLSGQYPDLVSKLMVVDTGVRPLQKDVLQPLKWMLDMPVPVESRKVASEHISQFTKEQNLINFLLTNLKVERQKWFWRLDLKGLVQLVAEMSSVSLEEDWEKIICPTHLVRGENSTHLSVEEAKKMKKQKNKGILSTVANAGHWCHAEQPQQFSKILQEFVKKTI